MHNDEKMAKDYHWKDRKLFDQNLIQREVFMGFKLVFELLQWIAMKCSQFMFDLLITLMSIPCRLKVFRMQYD